MSLFVERIRTFLHLKRTVEKQGVLTTPTVTISAPEKPPEHAAPVIKQDVPNGEKPIMVYNAVEASQRVPPPHIISVPPKILEIKPDQPEKPLKRKAYRRLHAEEAKKEDPVIDMDMHDSPAGTENLFPGFAGTRRVDGLFQVSRNTVPWLGEARKIPLVEVTLRDTGKKILLGSVLKGNKQIQHAADNLDEHRRRITDTLFYTQLQKYINYGKGVERVKYVVSDTPIYYFSNPGGQRVYFIRLNRNPASSLRSGASGRIDKITPDIPVILRIAVCDKSDQRDVLSQLTHLKLSKLKAISGL